jgi:hypothetical protein
VTFRVNSGLLGVDRTDQMEFAGVATFKTLSADNATLIYLSGYRIRFTRVIYSSRGLEFLVDLKSPDRKSFSILKNKVILVPGRGTLTSMISSSDSAA